MENKIESFIIEDESIVQNDYFTENEPSIFI